VHKGFSPSNEPGGTAQLAVLSPFATLVREVCPVHVRDEDHCFHLGIHSGSVTFSLEDKFLSYLYFTENVNF
jgi:hypothetical protein